MIRHSHFRKESPVESTTTSGGAAGMAFPSATSTNTTASNSWYEALAMAWGQALDNQASTISGLSNQINNAGSDTPSSMVQLTAESEKMSFLANNASTSNNSVGEALQTLGKK